MNGIESIPARPETGAVASERSDKFHRAPAFLAVFAIAALLVTVVVAGVASRQQEHTALVNETAELATPTVTVVSPSPGKAAATLLLPAEVKPWIDAPIHARASGYVKRRLVDIGAQVADGQLLAELETPELDQELECARHELAQAEAALTLARTTAGRYVELLKEDGVSEQLADEKQADYALMNAGAARARANVRRLEDLQAFARVTAPFAGTITARNVEVGELIVAGNARELFRLAQADTLRVYVRVPQTDAFSVRSGESAEMLIPELPGRVFAATVVSSAGAISVDSRTLLTQLEVDNARNDILPGCFAQVRFTAKQHEAGLVLPANALLFRAEGPQVGVVRLDGKVELREVNLGRDFGQTVEILAGLSRDDRVILNPSDSLVDGATVRIAESAATRKAQ